MATEGNGGWWQSAGLWTAIGAIAAVISIGIAVYAALPHREINVAAAGPPGTSKATRLPDPCDAPSAGLASTYGLGIAHEQLYGNSRGCIWPAQPRGWSSGVITVAETLGAWAPQAIETPARIRGLPDALQTHPRGIDTCQVEWPTRFGWAAVSSFVQDKASDACPATEAFAAAIASYLPDHKVAA